MIWLSGTNTPIRSATFRDLLKREAGCEARREELGTDLTRMAKELDDQRKSMPSRSFGC